MAVQSVCHNGQPNTVGLYWTPLEALCTHKAIICDVSSNVLWAAIPWFCRLSLHLTWGHTGSTVDHANHAVGQHGSLSLQPYFSFFRRARIFQQRGRTLKQATMATGLCFFISSPHRDVFLPALSPKERNTWDSRP